MIFLRSYWICHVVWLSFSAADIQQSKMQLCFCKDTIFLSYWQQIARDFFILWQFNDKCSPRIKLSGAALTAEKHNVLRFQIREKRAENFEASCGAVQRSILCFAANLSQSMLCGDFVYQWSLFYVPKHTVLRGKIVKVGCSLWLFCPAIHIVLRPNFDYLGIKNSFSWYGNGMKRCSVTAKWALWNVNFNFSRCQDFSYRGRLFATFRQARGSRRESGGCRRLRLINKKKRHK